jgi:hypothetical protein
MNDQQSSCINKLKSLVTLIVKREDYDANILLKIKQIINDKKLTNNQIITKIKDLYSSHGK